MQTPPELKSPPSPRFDLVSAAILAGVIVMLALSAMNLWGMKRLDERVDTIEAAVRRGRSSGPDPGQVHTVSTAGAPARGPEHAPVTIVEFSDFQCPFCAKVVPTLKQIEEKYGERVRIVWKHLPLDIHRDAVGAALAAEAAGQQGKFWEYHDKLFANQDRLSADDLTQYAKDLRLDLTRFESNLRGATEKQRIDADVADAKTLGIEGTPGIFINGRYLAGAQPFEVFEKVIDEELTKRSLPIPPSPMSN